MHLSSGCYRNVYILWRTPDNGSNDFASCLGRGVSKAFLTKHDSKHTWVYDADCVDETRFTNKSCDSLYHLSLLNRINPLAIDKQSNI